MEITYADSWSDMALPWDMALCVMKWRSAWSIFHGPVILPFILKTIWCMYIILSEYESVWPDVWPQINVGHCDLYFMVQWLCLIPWRLFHVWTSFYLDYESVWPDAWSKNKYRSPWPIFHGPMILPYILTTIWCMYIILSEYESVRPDVWPQNKCRSMWPIFHGPVIVPYTLKASSCMNIIIWDYKSLWSDASPQNKCSTPWPIFHGPVILCYIFKTFWCRNIILGDYGSVWSEVWPQNKCMSLWHLYFVVHWFCLISQRLLDGWVSYF